MTETLKPLVDHALPKEELSKETVRLISNIKEVLRRSPEFQQASANSFLDDGSRSASFQGDHVFNRPVSFEKDGNRYTISRIPNYVDTFGEEVKMKKQIKGGTVIAVYASNLHETPTFIPIPPFTKTLHEISFSQTLPGSKEEKIKNTRMTVDKIDQFIRELNSPSPATS